MLHKLDNNTVWMATPSAGRPETVPDMQTKFGPLTWYVPHHQFKAYRAAGAAQLRNGSDTDVVPVRNQILKDAFAENAVCIQLDDDIKWAKRVVQFDPTVTVPLDPLEGLTELVGRVVDSPYCLGGVPPTNNAWFSNRRTSSRHHVRSHVWAVCPSRQRVDKNLKVKFDYAFTIEHIRAHGGVCRCDDLIYDADFGKRPGGHVDTRTREIEEADIAYLLHKYPGWVRLNPKRPGEVLLTAPQLKREVLV